MSIARRSRRTEVNIWPAFVDALGQLVIAIIFLLLIFTVAQFLTTDALSGRDQALQRLTQQINELTDLLNIERRTGEDLRLNVAQLSTELQNSSAAKDALTTRVLRRARVLQLGRQLRDVEAQILAGAPLDIEQIGQLVDLLRQALQRLVAARQRVGG